MRTPLLMRIITAMTIFACTHAQATNINARGDCNIVLGDIRNSQISIHMDNCTVSRSGAPGRQNLPIQEIQSCHCTAQKTFVKRLETEIVRMCRGICERPGYDQAYDMLAKIRAQVPSCCHASILEEVMRAGEVSCKVKLVSSAWLSAPDQAREDVISLARRKFSKNKMDECNLATADQ